MDLVPDLGRLVETIEREHPDAGSAGQLRAAVAVAEDLRLLGDQVLDRFVRSARAKGSSWTEIGEALGVSKQGAQQRYTQVRRGAIQPWPAGFSAAAQAVIARSVDEARALGHRYLGTEHVLLGLLSADGGLAAEALSRLGLTHDDTRASVVDVIGRGQYAGESLGATPRTKRTFEAARQEAKRLGHRCPEPEHLLLGLFSVSHGVARELLEAQAPELAERIRRRRRRLVRH